MENMSLLMGHQCLQQPPPQLDYLEVNDLEPEMRERCNTWPLRKPNPEAQTSPLINERIAEEAEDDAFDSFNGGDCSPFGDRDSVVGGGSNSCMSNVGELSIGCDLSSPVSKKSTSRKNAWGNLSYADLITQAIQSSPEKRLTLSQIYDWMIQTVPYFKDKGDSNSSAGWKNSIRHNLSLHSRFVRVQNEGAGKSSWWVINPDAKPGKASRRRAHTMAQSSTSLSQKRGRVKKKLQELQAQQNGNHLGPGTLSPSALSDELFPGDFRQRSDSNLSNYSVTSGCTAGTGRLSPCGEDFEDLDELSTKYLPRGGVDYPADLNFDNMKINDMSASAGLLAMHQPPNSHSSMETTIDDSYVMTNSGGRTSSFTCDPQPSQKLNGCSAPNGSTQHQSPLSFYTNSPGSYGTAIPNQTSPLKGSIATTHIHHQNNNIASARNTAVRLVSGSASTGGQSPSAIYGMSSTQQLSPAHANQPTVAMLPNHLANTGPLLETQQQQQRISHPSDSIQSEMLFKQEPTGGINGFHHDRIYAPPNRTILPSRTQVTSESMGENPSPSFYQQQQPTNSNNYVPPGHHLATTPRQNNVQASMLRDVLSQKIQVTHSVVNGHHNASSHHHPGMSTTVNVNYFHGAHHPHLAYHQNGSPSIGTLPGTTQCNYIPSDLADLEIGSLHFDQLTANQASFSCDVESVLKQEIAASGGVDLFEKNSFTGLV